MSLIGSIIIRKGTWYLSSKKDPRWNTNGRSDVGGLVMPPACQAKIDELKLTLGEPPDDLEWGYWKD